MENVFVDVACDEDAFARERVIPCKKLPYNVTGTTYVVYKFPDEKALSKAGFECTLKFLVKDCDPETGEPDDMDGYPEEYEVSLRAKVQRKRYKIREKSKKNALFFLNFNLLLCEGYCNSIFRTTKNITDATRDLFVHS